MKPVLSTRQAQIVERVAKGMPYKEIANDLGLSVRTVEEHVRLAAKKVPGKGTPRYRLWFFFGSTED